MPNQIPILELLFHTAMGAIINIAVTNSFDLGVVTGWQRQRTAVYGGFALLIASIQKENLKMAALAVGLIITAFAQCYNDANDNVLGFRPKM